jgi:hypothetical protein
VIHWDDVGVMLFRGANVCRQNNTRQAVEAVLFVVSESSL